MGSYVSATKAQQGEMLQEVGYEDYDAPSSHTPGNVRLKELAIPEGCSELEAGRWITAIVDNNIIYLHTFHGADAYYHYIPAIVKNVTTKEDFVTAYTPYQAEISQGNLQAIFKFQTMIHELTDMDAANASVYDGATAAAGNVFMCRDRKRTKVLVPATTNPQVLETMKTYRFSRDTDILAVPAKDDVTSRKALVEMLDTSVCCFYRQQPNYYGTLEDSKALGELVHGAGGKFIMGVNPIALAIMEMPAQCDVGVAVGEGQPLGMPLAFGGPYLGFTAATKEMMRKLPDRIVGETVDTDGKRGFVLALQTREQHIRREKASSNICSNQALCVLTASVYLSAMGSEGLKRVATLCISKAHYLRDKLERAGLRPAYDQPFFHEFVTKCPVDGKVLMSQLESRGFLGGLLLEDKRILWCATEMNEKAEIDRLAELVKEVRGW